MAGSCSGTRLFVAFCCLTLVAGFVGNVLSSAAWRLGLGQGRLGQKSLQRSAAIMKEAKTLLPGGVSSPVRAFAAVGGDPIVFDSVKGSRITDVDGNGYIDFVGSWGTAIVGHAHPEVLRAVTQTAAKGTSFGAPSALENELVKSVRRLMPSIDLLRFTSSGTEACMGALRVARAFTGRRKVIKFDGCYHGHADSFLVKAGSGVATLGHPDSPGVPAAATADTLVAEFNNIQSVRALLESPAHRGQVAAVIVEPIVGNAGFITPRAGFLAQLRELCTKHGALLVFDEVMTGFRVAPGGAQALYGVRPDLTTMGKIIGGGLPVGAFGGRRDVMSMLAPAGPVYQAGTLSGNPLAMAAGIKTLEILQREAAKGTGAPVGAAVGAVAGYRNENAAYDRMHALSGRFVEGLKAAFRQHYRGSRPVSLQGSHINGMFGYFFNAAPVGNYADAKRSDASLFRRFHSEMLKRGVYLPPSPYEACFMTLAHTEADIDRALEAAAEVFKTL